MLKKFTGNTYLIQYIYCSLNYYPDWQLPSPKTWDKFWFKSYKRNGNLVDYIKGDFNGDGKIDHGFILQRNQNFTVWAIQSSGKNYKAINLYEASTNLATKKLDIGLDTMPKGRLDYIDYKHTDDENFVNIKNTAIQIVEFERTGKTYYWVKDKYKSVITGD